MKSRVDQFKSPAVRSAVLALEALQHDPEVQELNRRDLLKARRAFWRRMTGVGLPAVVLLINLALLWVAVYYIGMDLTWRSVAAAFGVPLLAGVTLYPR